MKNEACPHEGSIIRAVRTGHGRDSVSGHLRECAGCRETAEITQWMGSLAKSVEATGPMHDPGLVWARARVFHEQTRRERALAPLSFVWFLVQTGLTLALAVWLIQSRLVESALSNLANRHADISAAIAVKLGTGIAFLTPPTLWVILTLAGLVVVWIAYPVFAED